MNFKKIKSIYYSEEFYYAYELNDFKIKAHACADYFDKTENWLEIKIDKNQKEVLEKLNNHGIFYKKSIF